VDGAVIGIGSRGVERVAERGVLAHSSAVEDSGVAGDRVGSRIVIRPGHSRTRRDVQCSLRESEVHYGHTGSLRHSRGRTCHGRVCCLRGIAPSAARGRGNHGQYRKNTEYGRQSDFHFFLRKFSWVKSNPNHVK